jgi:hypothetical protein
MGLGIRDAHAGGRIHMNMGNPLGQLVEMWVFLGYLKSFIHIRRYGEGNPQQSRLDNGDGICNLLGEHETKENRRNPKTEEQIKISASKTVKLKPESALTANLHHNCDKEAGE